MKEFKLYEQFPELEVCRENIEKAVGLMVRTARSGGTVYIAGNGGSAADCEHIVGELMKSFSVHRPSPAQTNPELAKYPWADKLQCGIRAVSLPSQSAIFTAYSNDLEFVSVYAQLLCAYAKRGDLFIGISTSGNSESIVRAFQAASALGIDSIALTGSRPCKLDALSDCVIKAPHTETYRIQEYHLPIYHYLCGRTETVLFGE